MTLMEISNARLISQKIVKPEFKTPKDVIRWMGAIQAQDYSMAKWAVGVRLKDSSDETVESAINKGEIIRIHVLRPTWHFVGAEDIHWMRQLSGPKIKSSLRGRHNELELSELIIKKTQSIIEKKLSKEFSLTTEELANEFLISYRDRSSSLSTIYNKKTVSNNGIFYPVIVVKGQVAGLWRRTSQKNKVTNRNGLFPAS